MTATGKLHRNGFTLLEVIIVIAIIALIAAIAIPNLLRARINSNESSTIQNLRAILSAQGAYFAANGEFAIDMESMTTPVPAFLSHDFLQNPLSGYQITFGGDEINYTLNANPTTWYVTGIRGFYTDASGIIRHNIGAPADSNSPTIH